MGLHVVMFLSSLFFPLLLILSPLCLVNVSSGVFRSQISEEIAERQSHLDEMRRLGASNRDTEALLSSEISQRVAELNRLNAQLDTL